MVLHPAMALALSFLAVILVGSVFLYLPLSVKDGAHIAYLDALFTATSAVCVTGLTVHDTGSFFTPFGQGVILALIQAGALGIMTLSTAAAVLIKKTMTITQRKVFQELLDQDYYDELMDLMRGIVKGTFLIEFIGAIILTVAWWDSAPNYITAIAWGVFHSVSAFCNAGFALFPDSLMSFSSRPLIIMTISILVITGGLGFVVVGPLLAFRRPKGAHAKLVVWTTVILLSIGTVFYFFAEYDRLYLDQPLWQKLMSAWFQSVTARTAGFDTIPQENLSYGSTLVTNLLMFIGASPGSTGGGIKTTTFAILILAVRAWIRRRPDVEMAHRSFHIDLILKAVAVVILSSMTLFVFTVALTFTEKADFHVIIFEAFSAFGTVGLSQGLTPHLTGIGKFLITLLMFIGRLGPITIAVIVSKPKRVGRWHYPNGRVMIG